MGSLTCKVYIWGESWMDVVWSCISLAFTAAVVSKCWGSNKNSSSLSFCLISLRCSSLADFHECWNITWGIDNSSNNSILYYGNSNSAIGAPIAVYSKTPIADLEVPRESPSELRGQPPIAVFAIGMLKCALPLFLLMSWSQKYHFQPCTIFSCKMFEF